MRPCHVIEITTPKKFVLNGLWFGPKKPKRVIIWIHGLGSSAFTKLYIVDKLVSKKTAVITFNNRGHDKVSSVSSTRNKRIRGGAAHEVFADCVDDIQGAIRFAKRAGAQSVVLAGHSTGCQKSAYWAAKKGKDVKGIILLAPMSDYAAEVKVSGKAKMSSALSTARRLVKAGRQHELIPESVWGWPLLADAQRFISLYSAKSAEEIFTYWDPKRVPKTLRRIRLPILILLAEKDEYADRPAVEIAAWFKKYAKKSDSVRIVPKVKHSFEGGEKIVARAIGDFIKIGVKYRQ
ncbi:alpha/beta fold hydrolase [Candidatus Kaiserbacteria bacterium]|nr:alpha/beta fold hydrolase [Candidatus Kaiserbacteria bacterium]